MPSAIVLGAGMAGVSAALRLQDRGWEVAVVDRQAPGLAASYGNAGVIQSEVVEPYAMPRDIRSLWAIARGSTNDVRYHLRHLGPYLVPLLRYWWHSAPKRHRRAALAYSRLIERACEAHAPLIEAAGASDLVRRDGFRVLHRTAAAMDRAVETAERLRSEYGVPFRSLSPAELSAAEPGLLQAGAGAVHWLGPWTVRDPGALVSAYAELFARRGGTVALGDAASLAERPAGGWAVETAGGPLEAEHAVVALGPWSGRLLRRFALRFPMIHKRGYHRHYGGRPLDLPLMDAANGFVMAPMSRGLRITTGAELTGLEAGATPRQLERAENAARELVRLGPAIEDEPWFGTRPCMPDMLPVVGQVRPLKDLWAHFGHGHQGFTLGPATAELLADLMSGRAPPIDPSPFSPDRYRARLRPLNPAARYGFSPTGTGGGSLRSRSVMRRLDAR